MFLNKACMTAASITILTALCLIPAFSSSGPSFRADAVIRGSSLAGWHTLGQADWKAVNGEVTGTPKTPAGGWLFLDKSFQNVGFYADVLCTTGCKSGVLLRAEKTPDGMKGVFVSFTEGDLNSYAVKLNAEGQEISRQKLATATRDLQGGAPNPNAAVVVAAAQAGRGGGRGSTPQLPPGVDLPNLKRPTGTYKPGEANGFEVLVNEATVKAALNAGALGGGAGGISGGVTDPSAGTYGPIAIYVGGTGAVHLKNVMYKDLSLRESPPEQLSKNFTMQRLNAMYYSWSAAVADVNQDGKPDVIAGPFYYLGPDFSVAHEIYPPVAYNPTKDYAQLSMVNLAYDFTGDGWADVLVMSGNAGNGVGTLYVNPRGESRDWDHYVVLEPVGNEETLMADIDGDGKPEIIHAGNNALRYSKPDPGNPTGKWITRTISEPGPWGVNIGHGLGVGDINSDGRMDFISAYGWWEQPAKDSRQELWTWHPQAFGRWGSSAGGAGGAAIGVYDVNGDGLNDVVTPMEGHTFGLAWYEQKRDGAGKISFVEHIIMDNFLTKNAGDVIFTEPHAATYSDIDGDGIPDFITGKRAMSHLAEYADPDPFGPAVLYVYKVVRNKNVPGGAEFVPELVHNQSGVGSHIVAADLNGDRTPDIVTSGVYGTFIFFNHEPRPARAAR